MGETLKVSWRQVVYEVAVCLDAPARARAEAQWPGGVVDLARLLDPERATSFSMRERRSLARSVLRALGEPLPSRIATLPPAVPPRVPAAAVGAFAEPRAERSAAVPAPKAVTVPQLDHATLTSLLLKPPPRSRPFRADGVREIKP